MKRYKLLLLSLTILLVFSCASASLGFFPKPDTYLTYKLQMGWFNGVQVWYICTDTNNINTAVQRCLTFSYKLDSAVGVAPKMWEVINPVQTQGPIFSTEPGAPDYSGLWQIFRLQWQPGFLPVPLISEADVLAAIGAGAVVEIDTGIIVDCPVIAEGVLGGPWLPAPPNTYRLPQVKVYPDYPYTKRVQLPAFFVFCQDIVSHRVCKDLIIIPDAETPFWATKLGANLAPGLGDIPQPDTQALFYQPTGPQLCQFPVEEWCPSSCFPRNMLPPPPAPASTPVNILRSCLNTNPNYSPIERLVTLQRNIPPASVINNPIYIKQLLLSGGLVAQVDEPRLNTPIISTKIIKVVTNGSSF